MESRETGSLMRDTGSSHSSKVLALTLRKIALTKDAFDSPITLRASSTVADTAA